MVGKTRFAGFAAAILAVGLLAGCGDEKSGNGDKPKPKPPVIVADISLEVDEKLSSFNKAEVTADQPGTIRITILNPKTSKGQHGVGIDGGAYKDVKGAPVKPGLSTSLTVDVKAGKYVIFDSYQDNRSKGYKTDLSVKGKKK